MSETYYQIRQRQRRETLEALEAALREIETECPHCGEAMLDGEPVNRTQKYVLCIGCGGGI